MDKVRTETGLSEEGEPIAKDETGRSENPTSDDQNPIEKILSDPSVQEEIAKRIQAETDRRMTLFVKKQKEEAERRVREAKEQAEREAREAKLLEDGKHEELIEQLKQEVAKSKTELENYLRKEKVNALLDKKNITDKTIRRLFHEVKVDLETLDGMIDEYLERESERVSEAVNTKLKTELPPKGDNQRNTKKNKTLAEQVKEAERKAIKSGKPEDWEVCKRLKFQLSQEIADSFHRNQLLANINR